MHPRNGKLTKPLFRSLCWRPRPAASRPLLCTANPRHIEQCQKAILSWFHYCLEDVSRAHMLPPDSARLRSISHLFLRIWLACLARNGSMQLWVKVLVCFDAPRRPWPGGCTPKQKPKKPSRAYRPLIRSRPAMMRALSRSGDGLSLAPKLPRDKTVSGQWAADGGRRAVGSVMRRWRSSSRSGSSRSSVVVVIVVVVVVVVVIIVVGFVFAVFAILILILILVLVNSRRLAGRPSRASS